MSCRNIPNPSLLGTTRMPRRQQVAQARALSGILGRQIPVSLTESLEDSDVRQRVTNADFESRLTALSDLVNPGSDTEGIVRTKRVLITDAIFAAGASTILLPATSGNEIYRLLSSIAFCDVTNGPAVSITGTIRYDGPTTTRTLMAAFTIMTGGLAARRYWTADAGTFNTQTTTEELRGAAVILTLNAAATSFATNGGMRLMFSYFTF